MGYYPQLILKTHKENVSGFVNGTLTVDCGYEESLTSVMSKLNNFRSPNSKINTLYNSLGDVLPQSAWNMKLKDKSTILFIDSN